ncbi:MAG TPA: sugar nucleotide-binding protein, partial [Longimicrobiaceae bacterium]|nr:sugar nucleotide-binding protein [Longimicrobiaceae bacterium]
MLGRAVVQEFRSRDHEVAALGRAELDVTRPDEVRLRLEEHRPEVVIQCAAYTAVDAAESEPEEAVRVNGMGAEIVVEACQRTGAAFVYPSTDYVFSGESQRPWNPEDRPAPLNAYGRSKMAGEQAALSSAGSMVVRTSWLYGAGGANFVDAILNRARERGELEVVDDQVGIPTWT